MNAHATDLTSLISTRICHDLVNPIGAIGNGLELLEEMKLETGPEMELISESVASANAKLSYFRIAFGEAKEGSELPGQSVKKTIEAMYSTGRFHASWDISDVPLKRGTAKLVFLLVQCMESCLPLGGKCVVAIEPDGWRIDASGPRVTENTVLWDMVRTGAAPSDLSSRDVHFAVAAQCAQQFGTSVEIATGEAALSAAIRT